MKIEIKNRALYAENERVFSFYGRPLTEKMMLKIAEGEATTEDIARAIYGITDKSSERRKKNALDLVSKLISRTRKDIENVNNRSGRWLPFYYKQKTWGIYADNLKDVRRPPRG